MNDSVHMSKVTIYLARHGECEGNVSDNFLDPFTDALTEVGKAQAERLGSHLKNIPFSQAFSSDYLRAEQTARITIDELKTLTPEIKLNLVTDNRLRERDSTGMIGEPTAVAWVLMATSRDSCGTGTSTASSMEGPNCEAMDTFESRIIDFFTELVQDLVESSKEKPSHQNNILIVSHGIAIQTLMCLLNSRYTEFGIHQWDNNEPEYSEKLIKNARYHKIWLEISAYPQDNESPHRCEAKVRGGVESVHCSDHLDSNLDAGENTDNENANSD